MFYLIFFQMELQKHNWRDVCFCFMCSSKLVWVQDTEPVPKQVNVEEGDRSFESVWVHRSTKMWVLGCEECLLGPLALA